MFTMCERPKKINKRYGFVPTKNVLLSDGGGGGLKDKACRFYLEIFNLKHVMFRIKNCSQTNLVKSI